MRELDNTSTPLPFECAYAIEVDEPSTVEQLIHDAFADRRTRSTREFFEINPARIISALRLPGGRDITPDTDIVEDEESPIRVILSDGTELILRDATIRSDSIITGRVRFGTENLLVRDVSRIEVQRFSPFRTIGVVVLPFTILAYYRWLGDASR